MPSPEELARVAASQGMPALALTDYQGLTGAFSFYRACVTEGIRPILGLEIEAQIPDQLSKLKGQKKTGRLVLLAMNITGWRNLCRLSSNLLINKNVEGNLSCDLEQLSLLSEGLLCLSGGTVGPLADLFRFPESGINGARILHNLKEIFPGRLYVELNRHFPSDDNANDQLAQIAARAGLRVVAAHPVFYIDPNHAKLQETVSSIRLVKPISRLAPGDSAPPGSYFTTALEMQRGFARLPESIASVSDIIDQCNVELPLGELNYPAFPLPPEMSAIDELRQRAVDGANELYPPDSLKDILPRLEHELSVIETKGYAPIFLIAADIIGYAKSEGIPFASRGSASSSLVAHCTGITTPDPLALDLYFERFLNPARSTPPDIDTDFCSRRRDRVIRHLFETYGKDRVAMVGTINTFRPRSALGEVAKAHGIDPAEIRSLTSKLSHRYRPSDTNSETTKGEERQVKNPFSELAVQYRGDLRYSIIFEQAASLLGLPHHLSVHPGGVVIAPGPIIDYVPVTHSGGKGVMITQLNLDDVEQAGLVKLDVLGIRGLTVLGDMADIIFSWRRKEYHTPHEVLEDIPQEDPTTSAILSTGQTIGCFQIESPGMRATLKDIHANSPADLMAALALYRPGPLKGGLRDAFVRRHKGEEPVSHIHPALSGLLLETHGVILYQEQVLRIAHELAGLSLAESDLLRRAMSHFDPGKQMQALRDKFITGAEERSGISVETGMQIWEMMAAFAGYGFPKAHAASYAQVAWRSAWCKAHFPAEFLAAVLANWGGYYPQSVYLNEARRLKIPLKPPHVNHSSRQFSTCYPKGEPVLYMGLDQIRDLTHRTQERIILYRPYHSLAEFIMKVDPRKVEVENLICVGSFDGLGIIPDLLLEVVQNISKPGQMPLFSISQSAQEDWSLEQKTAAQQRILNARLAAHPLELQAKKLHRAGVITTVEAANRVGEVVRVAGTRQIMHRSRTPHNEWIGFLTLEDLEGMIEVTILPGLFRNTRHLVTKSDTPLIIEGTVERDNITGDPVLIARWIIKLG